MKSTPSFFILPLFALAISCSKSPETPPNESNAELSVTVLDTVKGTWAMVSSSLISMGSTPITEHGFCWGTTPLPDLSSSHSSQGGMVIPGSFSFYIAGLTAQTTYYIRSYAQTGQVIAYGPQQTFSTIELQWPAVTTASASHLTSFSARGGGVVTGDGNGIVSSRGVCWNITGNPTLENALGFTADGSGTGSFNSDVTGLAQQTTYYMAAYATNEKGTAYGEVKWFVTPLPCGQQTVDYEGRIYHTVKIGEQCWFRENLNVGVRIDGIQNQDPANTFIEKYCFDDNEENCDLYGGLYQWDEMMSYASSPGSGGICPEGWSIPSDQEWTALTDFLGGEAVAGTKLKSADGWFGNGNGTNISGFTGLPNGNRGNNGVFNDLTRMAYFWSSTPAGASEAWNRKLYFDSDGVTKYNSFKTNGFAVRCIREN